MSSKSISFIKLTINIAMAILLAITFCIIVNLKSQNKVLNKTNYELTITIDTREGIISRLTQDNKDLNANVAQLEEVNCKLQDDNRLLEAQIQELLVPTSSYKDFKTYMSYKAITNQTSKQWQLQQQATTNEDGIRCIDEIPLVAVGTGWGLSVGDIALVTCNNGNSFKVMVGDIKADNHTDRENKTTVASGCRCEFIVEIGKLNPKVKIIGNMSTLSKYSGYVINIEKVS